MKGLLKKVRGDKKGFTLAELLVVVAIIGILVAISIPIFTAQLGKARKATNQANLRAAKAAAIAAYLSDETRAEDNDKTTATKDYIYYVADGTVKEVGGTGADEVKALSNPTTATIKDASSKALYTDIQVTITSAASDNVSFHVLPASATAN